MHKGFNPQSVWRPRGRGFSMGLVQSAGHTVYLTGQVAWDANESIVGQGDPREQTRQCFRNIEAVLQTVGGTLTDLVSVTAYFVHVDHLPEIQAVRRDVLVGDNPPVSTSVRVAGLGHPDFLVELTPIAVIPSERFRTPPASPTPETSR